VVVEPALRKPAQHGPLFLQPLLAAGVKISEEPLEEGRVFLAAVEVPAAAEKERLIKRPLKPVMPLLDVPVLVRLARPDLFAIRPVMP
jgi:hypothetical protein